MPEWFEMFSHGFMQKAFLAGGLVALICPAIGLFLVLRRMSLIGETLSHVVLAGVAGGMLTGIYPPLMGIGFSVAAVLGVEKLRTKYPHYAELSIAVIFSSALALAVILLSLKKTASADIFSYFFGSIIAINDNDLMILGVVGAVVLLVVGLFYRQLFYIAFHEDKARLSGLPVYSLNIALMVLTALVIAASMRVVGALLVSSLIVLPVAAGLQVARSFKEAFWLSLAYSLIAVVCGLISAYLLDWAPGGTIVLTAAMLLLLTLLTKGIWKKAA